MTRDTSIEAYNKIKSAGLLSERRMEIYEIVYYHGPMTSAEAFQIITRNRSITTISQSRARFTELREMGVLTETGTKVCSVTGMTVIEWDVTSKLPVTVEKLSKNQRKANLKADIREHIFPLIPLIYQHQIVDVINQIDEL